MEVAVDPSGSVSAAEVRSPTFQGTELGRCVSATIRRWRFPPFEGDLQRVDVPFVFRSRH
jgi:TonB family protein